VIAGRGVVEEDVPIYDEQAFGYLLAIEQKRSARSAGSFHLLLVTPREEQPDGSAAFTPAAAACIAGALSTCVRDSDFIGWYREPGTIGAVLTHDPRKTPPDLSMGAFDRVVDDMLRALPEEIVKAISVQLVEVPPVHSRS
jgi:hypothetical protein